jgi:hypothetical protein
VVNAVSASAAGKGGQIVVAGAGYAGLHVALRLTAKLRHHPVVELTLVDQHDYHQVLTELPRVAAGTRAADAVRLPLQDTRGSSSRSGHAAGSPTSPASPPAGTSPTCSKTPSSGNTSSPSRTCAAGTQ